MNALSSRSFFFRESDSKTNWLPTTVMCSVYVNVRLFLGYVPVGLLNWLCGGGAVGAAKKSIFCVLHIHFSRLCVYVLEAVGETTCSSSLKIAKASIQGQKGWRRFFFLNVHLKQLDSYLFILMIYHRVYLFIYQWNQIDNSAHNLNEPAKYHNW